MTPKMDSLTSGLPVPPAFPAPGQRGFWSWCYHAAMCALTLAVCGRPKPLSLEDMELPGYGYGYGCGYSRRRSKPIPEDGLDALRVLRESQRVYMDRAREAYRAGDWQGVEAMWRATESLATETRHAEIDFDRETGFLPAMDRKISTARLRDIEREMDSLDVRIERAERVRERSGS